MSPDVSAYYIGTAIVLLVIGGIGILFTSLAEENEGRFEYWSIGMLLKRLFQACIAMPLIGLLVWSVKLIVLLVVE